MVTQTLPPNESTVEARRDLVEAIRKRASYFADGKWHAQDNLATYAPTLATDCLFLLRMLDGGGLDVAPEAE